MSTTAIECVCNNIFINCNCKDYTKIVLVKYLIRYYEMYHVPTNAWYFNLVWGKLYCFGWASLLYLLRVPIALLPNIEIIRILCKTTVGSILNCTYLIISGKPICLYIYFKA